MKRPITISLSPNASLEDVRLARHLLFVHSYWNDRKALSRAAETLAVRFSRSFVTLASSGRQALYDLLKSFGIGRGDEVIIQAFTCIAVPEPILWLHAKPVYADIAEGSYSIDPEQVKKHITPKTKAIIIQHTFGIPGPIEEILALAKEHNIFVIEDCAHALGATYQGKALGTFGDGAVLSFGRDKCVSSVFGGATLVKDKSRLHTLQGMQGSRKLPPKTWVAQQLFHPVFFSFILPLYFWHGVGKALLVLAQKMNLISKAVAPEERATSRPVHFWYAYSPALALLLLEQMKRFDGDMLRRKKIVQRYQAEITNLSAEEKTYTEGASYLRFPIRTPYAREILLDARAHGMLLGDWYDAPLVPGASNMQAFGYVQGSCPRAEAVAKEVLNLPTYSALSDNQVTKIIDFMNSYGDSKNTN